MKKRIIGHIDMDAFFASVEERDNPRLKGLPIVVGADPAPEQVRYGAGPNAQIVWQATGRGVVSTANYKAREYGIHSALPISTAWRLSQKAKAQGKPEAIFIVPDFYKYSFPSRKIMEILHRHSSLVEQASIDEAYFDLSQAGSYQKAESISRKIKKEIQKKEKLIASIGIGHNKLIAKIASDMQKPDGLTVVTEDAVEEILNPLSIRKIPGIGPKTEARFNRRGIYKIKDLKKYTLAQMEEVLGKWGADLYYKVRGIDESPLEEEWERKSIGEQETFQEDSLDFNFVFKRMEALTESVFRTFNHGNFKTFKTITITVRFSDFDTRNRSHTLIKSDKLLKVIKVEAIKLLMPFFDARENPRNKKIRLIGVRIEKME